jgi:uroporphyrinogen decarboxylase
MSLRWRGEMEPMERWRALLRGDPVDRVPVFPLVSGYAAIANGYPNLGEFWEKPEVSYRCQLVAREMHGYDQPFTIIPPGYGAAEWGSKILFPYNPKMGSVATIDPVVKTADDVERLEVPDPKTAPHYRELTETLKRAVREKQFPLVMLTGGWISTVAPQIAPLETFMRWLKFQPDVAKKLLAKSREFAIRAAEHFVRELGSDTWMPWDGTPTDSNVLISPKTFGEVVLPSAMELHQKVLDLGAPMWFTHFCCNHHGNIKAGHIERIPMGKPGIIHFGPEVDVAFTVERFGRRNIVLGNVDPPSMVLKGHDDVVALARADIEKGKGSPKGYILGVGCELPPRAPPANVHALVRAAREYGRY